MIKIDFSDVEFKSFEKENTRFIHIRPISERKSNIVFEYTTKRGKKAYLYFYLFQGTEVGMNISFNTNVNMTQEIKINGSIIAHGIKHLIEQKNNVRIRKLTGSFPITFSGSILDDVDEYVKEKKKRRTASMKKAEVLALSDHFKSFYHNAKKLKLPKYNEDSYFESSVLLVYGREGRYLVDMLQDMNIASWKKWGKSYHLRFDFKDFESDSKSLEKYFQSEIERLGFKCYTHTWYD